MALLQDLTIFMDDDATPLVGTVDGSGNITEASCSTDPTHPRPYLRPVLSASDAQIRFMDGSSTIGAASVEVVDAPITPGDQDSGWFTSLLASQTTQNTQLLMRRAVLRQQDMDGTMRTLFDGIIVDPGLDTDMVTYKFSLRTARERERNNPIFQQCLSTSLLPPGVLNGYGTLPGTTTQIIPPAAWEYGIFRRDPNWGANGIYTGRVDLHDPNRYSTQWWSDWTDQHSEVLLQFGAPQVAFDPTSGTYLATRYVGVAAQWRSTSAGGAFTTLSQMPFNPTTVFDTSNVFIVTDRGLKGSSVKGHGNALSYIILSSTDQAAMPADGENVDVRILSALYPTSDYPMYIECTFGQLLKDLYDGKYAYDPANATVIRYDPDVMADLVAHTPLARLIVEEPVDDMFQWVSDQIYKPLLMAPAEDDSGRVTPVSAELPDATVVLPQLNDQQVFKGQWKHTKEDACTSVDGTYKRDFILPPDPSAPKFINAISGRGVDMSDAYARRSSVDVTFRRVFATTVLFGDKPFSLKCDTMRSVTSSIQGVAYTGDTMDEVGAQLLQGKAFKMIDRFSQGAQNLVLDCNAADPVVRGLKLGSWVQASISFLPDYKTRRRGINRLMQVVASKQTDPITRQLTLLDGGPFAQPVSAPVIGNLRMAADHALIDVTALPVDTGSAVRLEYNFGAIEPAEDDPHWLFMGRPMATGTVSSLSLPSGVTLWVRARGEKAGTRPSAWTNPLSVVIPLLPAITDVSLDLGFDNQVYLTFRDNGHVAGVRVDYLVTTDPGDTSPLASSVFLSSATLPVSLGVPVPSGWYLKAQLTPYSGWTGSAVSGTAGTLSGVLEVGSLPGDLVTGGAQIIPAVKYTISPANGAMSVTAKTSNPAVATLYGAVRLDHAPTIDDVLAGASAAAGAVDTVLTFTGPTVPTGSPFWIGSIQQYTDGTYGDLAITPGVFLGVNATPAPQVTVGAATIQADKVTFPLIVDDNCIELYVYAKQTSTPPAQPVDVEELVALPFKELDVGKDGLLVGQQYLLSIPLLGASFAVLATFVGYNPLGQPGTKVSMIAQGAGASAPTKPSAPTMDTPIHTAGQIGATVHDTNTTAPTDLIVYIDNVAQPAVTWTAGAGGTMSWYLTGMTPGRTYKTEALVRQAGVQSDRSAPLSITTDAAAGSGTGTTVNGKLPTPTISGSYDTGGTANVTVTNGGGWPSGTVFHLAWTGSPITPTKADEDPTSASTTTYLSSAFNQTPRSQTRLYAAWATCPGYTDSDLSTAVSITMPGYTGA